MRSNTESSDGTGAKLAIAGGSPVRSKPFAPWPMFDSEAINAVQKVLESGRVNYWTGGEGRQFEREFAELVGTKYAVALANGSLALELALQALEIGPGDDVIVPSRTFVATASSVAVHGASPVFADVDPISQNISADTIAAVLTPRTRAVIVVHLAGWPCDMSPIMELADRHGLKVIEDCAQAHGAVDKGRPVGSVGHAAAFSFCQDKIFTTGGEGGMLVTNDEQVWRRAWSYKDHGKSWDAIYNQNHKTVFKWLHESIGTNWRLTEMQSALGRVFIHRLNEWVEKRRRLASILNDRLSHLPGIQVYVPPTDQKHSYYRYYVHLEIGRLAPGWTRDGCVRALEAEGIPCGSGTCPEVYRERAFAGTSFFPPERHAVAASLGESTLALLVHPTLDDGDMIDTCRAMEKVLNVAVDSEQPPVASAA